MEAVLNSLLVNRIAPLVQRVVASQLRGQDASAQEDVCSSALARLLAPLRSHISSATAIATIDNLESYVVTVARNECFEHLRRRFPVRYRLRNRLRYLLLHDRTFRLWSDATGAQVCELSKEVPREPGLRRRVRAWFQGRRTRTAGLFSAAALRRAAVGCLEAAGGPVPVDALIEELTAGFEVDATNEALDALEQFAALDPLAAIERREQLAALWREILELPERQRAALLLNLREGEGNALPLLPATGTATLRHIAAAIGLQPAALAALWPRLPLEDTEIARILGLTRRQVINLRKCARERLARRMRGRF